MKKMISLLLSITMILSLAGCKSEDTAETMQNETTETTAFVYETEEIE